MQTDGSPLRAQRMEEPYRQPTRLEHDPLNSWGVLAGQRCPRLRIGSTFAALDPLAIATNRYGCIF